MKQKKAKEIVRTISILGYFRSIAFAILFALFIAFIFNLIFKEEFLMLLIVNILTLGTMIFVIIVFDNLRRYKEWARKTVIFLEFFGIFSLLGIMIFLAIEMGPPLGYSLTSVIFFSIIMTLLLLVVPIAMIYYLMFNKDIKKLFIKNKKLK